MESSAHGSRSEKPLAFLFPGNRGLHIGESDLAALWLLRGQAGPSRTQGSSGL